LARSKTKWGLVAVGAAVAVAGLATPGVPDLEIVGLLIMADGFGVKL